MKGTLISTEHNLHTYMKRQSLLGATNQLGCLPRTCRGLVLVVGMTLLHVPAGHIPSHWQGEVAWAAWGAPKLACTAVEEQLCRKGAVI